MRLTKRDGGGNATMDCGNCEIKYRESCCSLYLCRNALIDKLSTYEDAEEQGRLVILPCKVGDTVFVITERGFVAKGEVRNFRFFDKLIVDVEYHHYGTLATSRYWGETVFLTREEAEAALKNSIEKEN